MFKAFQGQWLDSEVESKCQGEQDIPLLDAESCSLSDAKRTVGIEDLRQRCVIAMGATKLLH